MGSNIRGRGDLDRLFRPCFLFFIYFLEELRGTAFSTLYDSFRVILSLPLMMSSGRLHQGVSFHFVMTVRHGASLFFLPFRSFREPFSPDSPPPPFLPSLPQHHLLKREGGREGNEGSPRGSRALGPSPLPLRGGV
jgi:hypothetical protein